MTNHQSVKQTRMEHLLVPGTVGHSGAGLAGALGPGSLDVNTGGRSLANDEESGQCPPVPLSEPIRPP